MTPPPEKPKLYHIVHVDRLASIVSDGHLLCDATMANRADAGSTIGMKPIKARRQAGRLQSHPALPVGGCVPFYFCPRSVMLYLISQQNHPDLEYKGGQGPIVHLELDLSRVVQWAEAEGLRWAFTSSNAGSSYFEDWADLARLDQIDWNAVRATDWRDPDVKQGKQAEFLVEGRVAWDLVERIGVRTNGIGQQAGAAIAAALSHPRIEIKHDWYY